MIEIEGPEYKTDNGWGIPIIRRQRIAVKDIIGFNYIMSKPSYEKTVHFFLDDHEFERVWNHPSKYIRLLKKFHAVFSPDFSLWMEYSRVIQLWNTYRNRMCGAYWQSQGIRVIPTVGWAGEDSFDFCFAGVEKGSTVAISTRGATHANAEIEGFRYGYTEMLRRIKPERVIVYGTMKRIGKLKGNVVHIPYEFYINEECTGKPIPGKGGL